MGGDDSKRSSKHKHRHDRDDREHKSKRKHKSEKDGSRKRSRKDGGGDHLHIDMWVEKNIDMDSQIMKSRAEAAPDDPSLPPPTRTESTLKRDEWMLMDLRPPPHDMMDGYGDVPANARTTGGGVDFFSSLGTGRKKKPPPNQPVPDKPFISHNELNTALKEGKSVDDLPDAPRKAVVAGGPGSQWRMMKLRRAYETADEEGKPIEEVALERFGSLEAFEEAKEERRILDEREGRRASRGPPPGGGERRMVFTDMSTPSGGTSRSSSFRRPDLDRSAPATPGLSDGGRRGKAAPRTGTPLAQAHTPIPSAMTPSLGGARPGPVGRAMSPSSLNKMQAKVLRAKLMGAANAGELEKEYERELKRANGEDAGEDNVRTRVEVMPTLDVHGRMYDVGQGKNDAPANLPGNRRPKATVEQRDPKTGEMVRADADDDTITLGEMLRQEKFGGGMADQKDLDTQFARQIMTDGGFQNNEDYLDENADKLARKKMRADHMKRQFAINDYKKTMKVLATCPFCYGEDDSLPKAPIVAMGTRAYLSCTLNEELTRALSHRTHSAPFVALEGDDDMWDEVRNFMKCLMKMFTEEDKGVVFYETLLSIKAQKHTFIECVPLPGSSSSRSQAQESILMSEAEWSQHKKLIDFSARPGGFRRAMVPNLPYFMVQFDYKGEKGYGHVIEGTSEVSGHGDDDVDEGEKGGGDFPGAWFAAEIIGNILDRPRKIDFHQNKERVKKFKKKYDQFDWTGMIERS
ncbi:CwfJ C-terminus 1-domain-containing protein-like protein [Epithele typhae]|uniref:CwfJ C-terminus 1-domain-containing protein-like protein n=1 Tax=Epithele typhae TaxID=378194 RepID=UPI002008827B|nr:CwfJ C-terminus 1-domain-containing protein-like protein [Epithele typhae]KAH9933124.1 CwfJ C-terminus 1-domain-containing protein-like protein [Epithele typhae]